MRSRSRFTAAVAAIATTAILAGCRRPLPDPLPAALPEGRAAGPAVSTPNAYDVVKMGRLGERMGPIYFAHALHADLPDLDGKIIPCAWCHFEECGPPRRCGECHLPHNRGSGPRLPST